MATEIETPAEVAAPEALLSVGKVARLTGLSVEVLRAWERRYDAVVPLRTSGGTRRYRMVDVERLRRLRRLVERGDRIGDVAGLDDAALEARLAASPEADDPAMGAVLAAIAELDGLALRRLLEERLDTLGTVGFARRFFVPLATTVGDRWQRGELSIAAEHLLTSVLRSLLVARLEGGRVEGQEAGPRVVFATPSGEPHDLGLVVAATVAMGAGARPIVLGADLPLEEVAESARRTRAEAVAIAVVTLDRVEAERWLRTLRAKLPDSVELWVGGAGARRLLPLRGARILADFAALEQEIAEIA